MANAQPAKRLHPTGGPLAAPARPLNPIVDLARYPQYRPKILGLLDEGLGVNNITQDRLQDLLVSGRVLGWIQDQRFLAGVVTGSISVQEDLDWLSQFGVDLDDLRLFGQLRSLVVARSQRHQGIGRRLVQTMTDVLLNQGARSVLTVAWLSADSDQAYQMLAACGFQPLQQVDYFWFDASLEMQYVCPRCGLPCHCSAVLMRYIS